TRGEGAARMPLPVFFGEEVKETHLLVDSSLVERIGCQIPIDVAGLEVRHHLWGRKHPELDVLVRIEPVLRDVVPKQEVVHGEVESDGKFEPFQSLGSRLSLCLT